MRERIRTKRTSRYLLLMIVFLLVVTVTLGYLLVRQAKASIVALMQTRMLDISNTAAAMVDGDVLKSVTPEDEGTEGYESVMRTLTYFQDNTDLKYIYCIRDMGNGTFTFGLDPTVEDPGEFGSPIVYTEALSQASKGIPSVDESSYEDAWGSFYSAYSPVYDSAGSVAGIIAVDFSAEWYNKQLTMLTQTSVLVALLSLLVGGGIVVAIVTKSERRIGFIQGQLNELETTLMEEMGNPSGMGAEAPSAPRQTDESGSLDSLGKQIQSMQVELKTQIAHVHGQAYRDGLTGVKSKQAYLEMEKALDEKLSLGPLPAFGIVVCDVNGLKKINDTLGHKAGDEYICKACEMICDVFSHSPVYRIGGDEFAVLLTGRDYENRHALVHELHEQSSRHISTNEAIVSGGLSDYVPNQDQSVHEVFVRADAMMYKEKTLLKSMGAVTRDDEANEPDPELDDIFSFSMRKKILIADDIEMNREILGELLEEDYDILYASDGVETLNQLRHHKGEIDLLLLDLYMPNMTGREVMERMQVDEDLMSIPVIVLTVDQDAELDCLKLGALDFVPKPYPSIEIVKVRIAKCIELSENRDLILHTQRDRLTGLLHYDFFIRYVERFDQHYEEAAMDAVACDVNGFHSINELYGRHYGDLVLRSVGMGINKFARRVGGIRCRKTGDTFLLYCPHMDDYERLTQKIMADAFVDKEMADKVELRFGVFADAQQEADIEERFARAQIAADSVEDDSGNVLGFYE